VKLTFTKMHGLGNDFAVVDLLTQRAKLSPAQIAALADRHRGIGFDQLLAVEPPQRPEADFRYRIFNTDGSEAEQCGNGARCFARFVVERGLTKKHTLVLEVPRGTITATLQDQGWVEVDMGAPSFALEAYPVTFGARAQAQGLSVELSTDAGPATLTLVSMGNPHGVVFVPSVAEAPVATLGAALQAHEAFPESLNVGFCEVVDRKRLRLRVYERGVGETQACGSGACAAVAAAREQGWVGDEVTVTLPGGDLRLRWQGPGTPLMMAGPTAFVYEGQVRI
jgi:diaminopimelate epimerase